MSRTTKEQILAKIKRAPKGKLFIINDFTSTGSDEAIRKTLHELAKEGTITRVYHGIYQKINHNEFLDLEIPATPLEIAEAIARKNRWTIAPAKDLALNQLGLDTQVPNSYDFISDGPSKTVDLADGRQITFRHVTQRESLLNPNSSLVVEAFKALGKERVTDQVLQQVRYKLSDAQFKQLQKDVVYSRAWIREKIRKMEDTT